MVASAERNFNTPRAEMTALHNKCTNGTQLMSHGNFFWNNITSSHYKAD